MRYFEWTVDTVFYKLINLNKLNSVAPNNKYAIFVSLSCSLNASNKDSNFNYNYEEFEKGILEIMCMRSLWYWLEARFSWNSVNLLILSCHHLLMSQSKWQFDDMLLSCWFWLLHGFCYSSTDPGKVSRDAAQTVQEGSNATPYYRYVVCRRRLSPQPCGRFREGKLLLGTPVRLRLSKQEHRARKRSANTCYNINNGIVCLLISETSS